jgi:hypothetical protein
MIIIGVDYHPSFQQIDFMGDQLIGKIQERYGIAKQEAEKQVDEFARSFRGEDPTQGARQGNQREGDHSTFKEKKRSAGQH